MNAVVQLEPRIDRLSEYFQAAGINVYPSWSKQIFLAHQPFPHQVGDLNHLAAYLPRNALYNEPGVGKTLPLQAFSIWMNSMSNRTVTIMPPVLVPQYYRSFHTNFPGIEKHQSIEMFQGAPAERQKMLDRWEKEGWPDTLVMSNNMFKGKGRSGTSDWSPGEPVNVATFCWAVLLERGYTLLIVDEAHSVKNAGSNLHHAVKYFVKPGLKDSSNGLVLSTGSPIETNVEDAYGLIALMDPFRYGSQRAFDRTHCVLQPFVSYRKVISYENLDFLYAGLYARGRRILKKDVIKDLPARLVTEINFDLSKPHKALYDKVTAEKLIELEDEMIDATDASALYQIVQQILLNPEKYTDKPIKENQMFEQIDNLLDTLEGRKVLMFCWYIASAQNLMKRYAHLNPALLNGSVTGAKRDQMKQKFIEDPTCRLMVANPRSAGVGVDGFQHVCSHVVFAEVCPFPGAFDQAVSRVHRTGQAAETINIYLLVPRGTVAVKLRNDLVRKEKNANEAVRDKKTLMADLMGAGGIQGVVE